MCFMHELIYLLNKLPEKKFMSNDMRIFSIDRYSQKAFIVTPLLTIYTNSAQMLLSAHLRPTLFISLLSLTNMITEKAISL